MHNVELARDYVRRARVRVPAPLVLCCAAHLMVAGVVELPAQEVELQLQSADAVVRDRFSRIVDVRELSDGRLLVADRQERFLYLVDPGTSAVSQVGRHGEGPGEYQNPGRLYPLSGDSTLFTDFWSRRWFILEGSRFVETLNPSRPLPLRMGPNLAGVDHRGRILGIEGVASSSLGIPDRGVADSVRVLLSSPAAVTGTVATIDTIAVVRGRGTLGVSETRTETRTGRIVSFRTSPLATEEQAWLFPDGWIAVALADPYRVDWRTPEGRWIRGGTLAAVPTRVDDDEKCFAAQRRGVACDRDVFPGWPEFVPPFVPDALVPGPDGRLLIARTPSASAPDNRYDVVDREGTLGSVIRLGANEAIVGFGRASVYVAETGERGLQTLRRIPWPPEG